VSFLVMMWRVARLVWMPVCLSDTKQIGAWSVDLNSQDDRVT